MSFVNLSANLNLNTAGFAAALASASKQTKTFAKQLNSTFGGGSKLSALTEEANKSKFAFKDVARVIQGIMLSRVFYAGLQAITGATAAVWEFSKSLEYAEIAYTNLFSSAELSTEFINVLQDFAAVTPFSFEQAEQSARRLLAYGMQYKNVMYVMQGVMAASSMSSDPQTVERVSRALGQIYTKGRLMNEELRQLAEAGIPVYEVLEEKLGLTKDQIANIGRERIGASTAINALVDGMNERFGGVLDASVMTMQGILSNIKDNLMMLTSAVVQPLFGVFKTYLAEFGNFLMGLRDALNTQGFGGLFEALVPEELQGTIRQLIAHLITLGRAISMIVASAGRWIAAFWNGLLPVINIFLSLVTPLVMALGALVQWLTRSEIAMGLLSSAAAFAAGILAVYYIRLAALWIIQKITVLINGLSIAFRVLSVVIVKSPMFVALAILIGLLAAVATTATAAGAAVRNLFGQVSNMMGLDPDKMLLPSQKDRAADLEKFNQALSGTSDGMDDLADSTGKAAKAAKGLLSFDEVFSLKAPDEGTDKGIGEGFDPLGGFDAGALVPPVPDLSEFAKGFEFELTDELKKRLLGAAIGGVLGGAIGGILTGGNPLGIQIGALVGGALGTFWPEIETWWMGWTTKLGEKIGIWYADTVIGFKEWEANLEQTLDDWYATTTADIDAWVDNTWASFTTWFDDTKAGIGNWFATTGQNIADWSTNASDDIANWALNAEASFNTWTENTGAKLGEWFFNTKTGITTWADETKTKFTTWWTETQTGFSTMVTNVVTTFSTLKTNLGLKVDEIKAAVKTKFDEIKTNITNAVKGAYDTVVGKFNDMKTTISSAVGTALSVLEGWKNNLKTRVFDKVAGYIDSAINKFKRLYGWAVDAAAAIGISLPAPPTSSSYGHATGGVFNREHVAKFAEGDKAEAIIPLENNSAMQPFVDAVANGLTATLAPLLAGAGGGAGNMQPLYVGTLIADDRGLRELERKMRVIRVQESQRIGE